MRDTSVVETNEQVLGTLLSCGYRASMAQLHRWRRLGLIPRPTRHGAGRGSTVVNPPGTAIQAIAAFRVLWSNESGEDTLWRLWLDGFRVDERQLRMQLAERSNICRARETLFSQLATDRPMSPKTSLASWADAHVAD